MEPLPGLNSGRPTENQGDDYNLMEKEKEEENEHDHEHEHGHEHEHEHGNKVGITPYILLLALGFHGFFEGMALGIQGDINGQHP